MRGLSILFVALFFLGVFGSKSIIASNSGLLFDNSAIEDRLLSVFDSSELQDPLAVNQKHLSRLKYYEGFNRFFRTGKGIQHEVIVAVLDTGVDLTHPDLVDNLWKNHIEANGQAGVDDDQNGYIDDIYGYNFGDKNGDPSHQTVNDHGTHVAGLVGAVGFNGIGVSGIMGRRVKVMPLNVFGRNWSTDLRWIGEAIRYAADNGARIINLSVGGEGRDLPTLEAIQYAESKGILVVVAAGNLAKNIADEFYTPASFALTEPGVLAVGAIDATHGRLCGFSNFSSTLVQLAAPGCDDTAPKQGLLSTRTQNQGSFGYKQGTSMAAPLVSGAAALYAAWIRTNLGRWPTGAELKSALMDSSTIDPQLESLIGNGSTLNIESLSLKL